LSQVSITLLIIFYLAYLLTIYCLCNPLIQIHNVNATETKNIDPPNILDTAISRSIDCDKSPVANNTNTAFNCITFWFTGTQGTNKLECSLDRSAFRDCITQSREKYDNGSITYVNLSPGHHSFSVAAVSSNDTPTQPIVDRSPATLVWTVDPSLPIHDIDGDGLPDNWEKDGIDINNDGIIDFDLPSHGANPHHKDIFVEVDYLQNHKPRREALDHLKGNFSAAPVDDPDSTKGINLHIETGDSIVETDDDELYILDSHHWPEFDTLKTRYFGTPSERANEFTLAAKRLAYHYALFAHTLSFSPVLSGLSEEPGNDFIISLGYCTTNNLDNFCYGTDSSGHVVGSIDQQEGAFMHELGHNLGLDHGGSDNYNCKPNYFSVMNYLFEFSDPIPKRPLTYSSLESSLDKRHLDEPVGIPGPSGYKTYYGPSITLNGAETLRETLTNRPVDYSVPPNNTTTDTDVAANVNDFRPDVAACVGSGSEHLRGLDDWHNLIYDFRQSNSFPDRIHLQVSFANASLVLPVRPEFAINDLKSFNNLLLNRIGYAIKNLTSNEIHHPDLSATVKDNLYNLIISRNATTANSLATLLPSLRIPTESLSTSLKSGHIETSIQRLNDMKSVVKSSLTPNGQKKIQPLVDDYIQVLNKQK
jgi:hypothetical protein